MIHDPLCTHERHSMCICGELRTARIEERARILKDEKDGKSYRMGRLDAANEVKRLANQIPQGSEYDPIWTALSAAIDTIERGVKKNDENSSDG